MRTSAIRPVFVYFMMCFSYSAQSFSMVPGASSKWHVTRELKGWLTCIQPLTRLRIRPSALQNQAGWDLRCACYKAEDAQPQRHLRSLAYSSSHFYYVYVKYLRSHRYFSSSASSSPFHLEYLYLSTCSHFPVEFTSFALIILKKWKVSKRKPPRT